MKVVNMHRRGLLEGVAVLPFPIFAGCSDDSGRPILIEYNYKVYDRVTHDSISGFYESDDQKAYVGVQIRVTNRADESYSFLVDFITLTANGSGADTTLHTRGHDEPFDTLASGETVSTWLLYVVPADANLGVAVTEVSGFARDEIELSENADLDIALSEYED